MFKSNFSNIRFRKNNKNKLRYLQTLKPNKLLDKYHQQIKSYIRGLLHPEMAVTTGFIPKAPNYVSIPTSNITFREAFDILPDANGEFILYWTPNFLASHDIIEERVGNAPIDKTKLEYSRNWLGGFDNTYNCFCYTPIASYKPPASFTKYRLVSAGCKITYKGPTINRSGIISSCLSYRQFPVVYFTRDENNIVSAEALYASNNFGKSINEIATTSIQNGMWNNVINVQKNQTAFSVAVPTDPSDFIFEDNGYFYSSATEENIVPYASIAWTDGNNNPVDFQAAPQLPSDGTPCTYIFKGTDLTENAKLYVEQFYNFEVIPTEESAPVLRPRLNNLDSSQIEKAKDLTNKILNKTKGRISQSDQDILKLIDDSLSWPSDMRPIGQIYQRPVVQQNKKQNRSQSLSQKAKNFGKDILNASKSVLKDVSNVVFTKDNMFKLGETIADILINKGIK